MTKKTQNLTSVKSLSLEALKKRVIELKKEFLKTKMDAGVQKGPKDIHAASKKRVEIAQIKTLITQMERKQPKNG